MGAGQNSLSEVQEEQVFYPVPGETHDEQNSRLEAEASVPIEGRR